MRPRVRALCALALAARATAVLAAGGPLAPGVEAFEARHYEEARRFLAPYAAAHPRDAEAAYYLGRSLLGLRNTDDAVDWLEKAVELSPKQSNYHLALGRAYGRAAQEASLLRKPGLAKSAHGEWVRAVELDAGNLDARGDLIDFYLLAPGFMGGSVDKAREQATEISKRDPVRGAIARADIAVHEKDDAAVVRILQEALAKNPREPRLQRAIGFLYQSKERWDDAFATFEAMVAADPQAWEALYQIGRTAALSGRRLDRGVEALQRYLGHPPGPDSPPLAYAHYRLGMVYERQGNKGAARAAYQAALKLDPKLDDARKALEKLG